jgi:hypothetical protein
LAVAAAARVDAAKLVVLRASAEELAAHEMYLDRLDREAAAGSVWRRA